MSERLKKILDWATNPPSSADVSTLMAYREMLEEMLELRQTLSVANALIGEAADEAKRLQDSIDAKDAEISRLHARCKVLRGTYLFRVRGSDLVGEWFRCSACRAVWCSSRGDLETHHPHCLAAPEDTK